MEHLEHVVSNVMLCPFSIRIVARQVVSLFVSQGDRIEEGQPLAVVEAMKMQNVLKAERGGSVSTLRCKPGDTLQVDAVMMEFDFD